jgi:dGTPase
VEQFEQRYADFPGLNLTFEVREGIVKHSRDYDPTKFPELAEYLLDLRPPLEAQLIDLADEIAYSTADLDDGVEAGILTREQVRREVPLFRRLYEEVAERYPDSTEKLRFNETLKRVMDTLVSDLIANTNQAIAAAGVGSVEQIRRIPQRLFGFSSLGDVERRQLKEFLYQNLYCSPASKVDKEDGEQMIGELFSFFMKFPEELPDSYRERTRAEQAPLHRIVCDYIAGMTDNFIREQHRRFCPGSQKVSV